MPNPENFSPYKDEPQEDESQSEPGEEYHTEEEKEEDYTADFDFFYANNLLMELDRDLESGDFNPRAMERKLQQFNHLLYFVSRNLRGNEFKAARLTTHITEFYGKYEEALDAEYDKLNERGEVPETKLDSDIYAVLPNRKYVDDLFNESRYLSQNTLSSLAQREVNWHETNDDDIKALSEFLAGFWTGSMSYHTAEDFNLFMKHNESRVREKILQRGDERDTEDLKDFEDASKEYQTLQKNWTKVIQRELYNNPALLSFSEKARKRISDEFEKHGIDGKDMVEALSSIRTEAPSVVQTLNEIEALDYDTPGTAKLLHDKFGIRHFNRYPLALLHNQAHPEDRIGPKNKENKPRPYGIVINPTSDWNGAFEAGYGVWVSLHSQLKKLGYDLRIMEADGKMEVARRLLQLNKEYGEENKISFAIIGGHGSENSISFGGEEEKQMLYSQDLTGRGTKKAVGFFEENPTIILVSCSTGVDKGIGEKLSKETGATVIAPDIPTNISSISIEEKDGRLNFDVKYRDEESRRVFNRGEKTPSS